MVKEKEKFIELALAKIQSDLEHLGVQFARIEQFTYSLSKRQVSTDKTLSFVKGGFYVFVSVFSIAMAMNYIIK